MTFVALAPLFPPVNTAHSFPSSSPALDTLGTPMRQDYRIPPKPAVPAAKGDVLGTDSLAKSRIIALLEAPVTLEGEDLTWCPSQQWGEGSVAYRESQPAGEGSPHRQ